MRLPPTEEGPQNLSELEILEDFPINDIKFIFSDFLDLQSINYNVNCRVGHDQKMTDIYYGRTEHDWAVDVEMSSFTDSRSM